MTQLIAKRLVAMAAVLLALTAIVFLLQKLSPINPVHSYLGANASASAIKIESKLLGYNRPIADQYLRYVGNLLQGNLGESLRTRRLVTTDLGAYLPATLELASFGLLLSVMLGGILGLATSSKSLVAGLFRVFMLIGASTPPFLLALFGLIVFYHDLNWLPATGRTSLANPPTGPTPFLTVDTLLHGEWFGFTDAVGHLILPGLCIAILPAVSIGRVFRSSLVATLRTDYVRTARSKGLREIVVLWRHAVRNSLGAALSMTGLQVGLMFAGVVVIESIFSWPGIGLYVAQSIPFGDFPAIAGVTLVLGVGYVLVNTVVDIAQAIADPRIKL
ncbi:MAG: ABC transporter permease [Acidimicrobiales bacterium]|jgi:peptide/nickel transport system permease protein